MSDKNQNFIVFELDDERYTTLPTVKFLNRKRWMKKDEKQVTAFIPGIIHKIHVKKGDTVKRGDVLLELEAMKMYNQVVCPLKEAKVKKILVKEQDKVIKDQVLIILK